MWVSPRHVHKRGVQPRSTIRNFFLKMLWMVLHVLFFIFVSLNHLNASELTDPDFNYSENQEISSIHNVQTLIDAETLNGNILKAAVRQKLREIFAIQFPNDKYNTRKYDIENWPERIESHGTINWRKDELVRINERIPFFKFIPRETIMKGSPFLNLFLEKRLPKSILTEK